MTQAAASTTNESALSSEEPSLWRDYEGRENARDRGVLTRANRSVRLEPVAAARGGVTDLSYALDVEVGGRRTGSEKGRQGQASGGKRRRKTLSAVELYETADERMLLTPKPA